METYKTQINSLKIKKTILANTLDLFIPDSEFDEFKAKIQYINAQIDILATNKNSFYVETFDINTISFQIDGNKGIYALCTTYDTLKDEYYGNPFFDIYNLEEDAEWKSDKSFLKEFICNRLDEIEIIPE